MKYKQGDAVFVQMETPSGQILTHPFLIISCRAANAIECYYTAVMMTSSKQRDQFSFSLSDDMFEGPINKHAGQIRTYIIVSFSESKIKSWCNTIKKMYLRMVLNEVKEYVLCVDS